MQLTRNQPYLYGYRGFESLPLRHKNPRQLHILILLWATSGPFLVSPLALVARVGLWLRRPVQENRIAKQLKGARGGSNLRPQPVALAIAGPGGCLVY
jgi:hypothetical protein